MLIIEGQKIGEKWLAVFRTVKSHILGYKKSIYTCRSSLYSEIMSRLDPEIFLRILKKIVSSKKKK